MIIGVPKEIKTSEERVGLTDSGVQQLVLEGHELLIEKNAGLGAGLKNESYAAAGARIVESAKEIYEASEMIIKVKEPLPEEYELFKEEQILYTFLHLAAEPELTKFLLKKNISAIGYETIQENNGELPLLTPMSEVAGRLAVQIGASYLQTNQGSKGILLGGATGVKKAKVCIIGGGVVGRNAAKIALGLGAQVNLLDIHIPTLEKLNQMFQGHIQTLYSNSQNIERSVVEADLVIGAVLVFAAKAPCLITKAMIQKMSPGSVVVDVAVDQGGCIETCKPTSHKSPIYRVADVIHYCVPNIPGIVAQTSTYALTNASLKYASIIASEGLEKSLEKHPPLKKGLNTYKGKVLCPPVAKALKGL